MITCSQILKTEGNGYCDCGDKEAFYKNPYCDNHMPNNESIRQTGNDSIETSIEKLPRDLVERFSNVIRCVFEYIVQAISGDLKYKFSSYL